MIQLYTKSDIHAVCTYLDESGAAWWIVIQYPPPFNRQIPWKFERIAVQGHPRSMILVPIESEYASSY